MKVLTGVGIVVGGLTLTAVAWLSLYPERTDPKNLCYQLWKYDLCRVNVPDAAAAMIGDPKRDALIVGKSKDELERRFGHLLSLSEAPPYLRRCYHEYGEEPRHDVRFISGSDWMVIFAGDKAIRLVNIKSCY